MTIHWLLILTDFDYEKTKSIILVSPELSRDWWEFSQDVYCSMVTSLNKETVKEYLDRKKF
jgi:uncharacterized OsmC-like protein